MCSSDITNELAVKEHPQVIIAIEVIFQGPGIITGDSKINREIHAKIRIMEYPVIALWKIRVGFPASYSPGITLVGLFGPELDVITGTTETISIIHWPEIIGPNFHRFIPVVTQEQELIKASQNRGIPFVDPGQGIGIAKLVKNEGELTVRVRGLANGVSVIKQIGSVDSIRILDCSAIQTFHKPESTIAVRPCICPVEGIRTPVVILCVRACIRVAKSKPCPCSIIVIRAVDSIRGRSHIDAICYTNTTQIAFVHAIAIECLFRSISNPWWGTALVNSSIRNVIVIKTYRGNPFVTLKLIHKTNRHILFLHDCRAIDGPRWIVQQFIDSASKFVWIQHSPVIAVDTGIAASIFENPNFRQGIPSIAFQFIKVRDVTPVYKVKSAAGIYLLQRFLRRELAIGPRFPASGHINAGSSLRQVLISIHGQISSTGVNEVDDVFIGCRDNRNVRVILDIIMNDILSVQHIHIGYHLLDSLLYRESILVIFRQAPI